MEIEMIIIVKIIAGLIIVSACLIYSLYKFANNDGGRNVQ